MPLVSEDFVKNAQALAEGVPALQAKLAEAEKNAGSAEKTAAEKAKLSPLVEATVNTLVEQGLIPSTEKTAASNNLMSHEETLQALLKTAQLVRAEPMGTTTQEKVASTNYSGSSRGDEMKDSDRMLLSRLGFSV